MNILPNSSLSPIPPTICGKLGQRRGPALGWQKRQGLPETLGQLRRRQDAYAHHTQAPSPRSSHPARPAGSKRSLRRPIGSKAPKARVAALCFDKIDLEKGVENAKSRRPRSEMLKHPWSILAFQLAGADGLKLIHADGKDAERDTPPAEPLVVELLSKPQQDDLSTLVLLDEVLMYIRAQVEAASDSRGALDQLFSSTSRKRS